MGLDVALFSLRNYHEIIADINYFLSKNLDNRFLVNYLRLIRLLSGNLIMQFALKRD